MLKVGIIGGGAAGLLLASQLSKNSEYLIDIIEKENRVGKKILQTGNGRCNFTNMRALPVHYNNPNFVEPIINKYSPEYVRKVFFELGLVSYQDEEGRCYPLSDSATSVLDVLRNACKINNVKELVNHEVIEITKMDKKYKVICLSENEKKSYEYDYIVISTGGSLKKPQFIETLNIDYKTTKESLCSIKANVSGLNGIRVSVDASLFIDGKYIAQDEGELLFKDGALSGIVMFNLSSYISRFDSYKKGHIKLDLLPDFIEEDNDLLWKNRINLLQDSSVEILMIGLFPKALAHYILKRLNISISKEVKNLTNDEIKKIKFICKNLIIEIKNPYASNNYQVVNGGIKVSQLRDLSLELKKFNNIYVGGEALDIDGECGGYNLHFAFACALKICDEITKK